MDVAKIDLNVVMLQVFRTHIANVYLDVAFSSKDLECSMQHEINVAAGFLVHY